MPKQKFSLDDILNEYSSTKDNVKIDNKESYDDQKLHNIISQDYKKASDIKLVSESEDEISATETVKVNDGSTTTTFSNSFGSNRLDGSYDRKLNRPKEEFIMPPNVKPLEVDDYSTPKIRPMSNSTRAREENPLYRQKAKRKNPRPLAEQKSKSLDINSSEPQRARVTNVPPHKKRAYPKAIEQDNSLDVYIKPERKRGKTADKKRKDNPDNVRKITSDIYNLKGTITLRIIVLTIMALFSTYITLANDYALPTLPAFKSATAPHSYAFTMIMIGGVSILTSMPVIINGLKKLFTFNADCDSLTSLTTVACIIAGFAILFDTTMLEVGKVHMFIPIAILSLLFNAVGKLLIVNRASRNIEYLTLNNDKHAIVFITDDRKAESITRGTFGDYPILATMRKTEALSDFLKYTFSTDIADRFCKFFTPIAFILSLVISVFSAIRLTNSPDVIVDKSALAAGASIFSMFISACSCVAITLVVNIPLSAAARKFNKSSSVILGYQSVDDFYDTNSVMVDAKSLFPKGMINLSAIKPYSDFKIDDAILLAASLTIHAGSILSDMFTSMVAGDNQMLFPVENFVYEDSMGVCGWINNKRVLLGNRALMTSHNIEGIPSKTKEFEYTENGKDAIYLSVSGNLSAMFIVEVNASVEVKHWLKEIQKEGIYLIIKSIDSIISLTRVSKLFKISEDMIKIIPSRMHKIFDSETESVRTQSASMACNGKFSTFAQLLISTNSIRQTSLFGTILQATSAILGFSIVMVFMAMKAYWQINVSTLIIYNLIWGLISVAIVKLRKV